MMISLAISFTLTYLLMMAYLLLKMVVKAKPGVFDVYYFPPPRLHVNGLAIRNFHKTFR